MKMDDEFWRAVREREPANRGTSAVGALNLALLFGTAAIALSLIVTPLLSGFQSGRQTAANPPLYDPVTTGSITKDTDKGPRRYTIRRSVLQDTPGAVCIIDINGNSNGC